MNMKNLDSFGPYQIILDHFYTLSFFGPFGQNGPNGPKWSKTVKNGPNGPKWSKMVQNGPEWSKQSRMVQNGTKRSRMVQTVQNDPKWSRMVETVQNGPNGPKSSKCKYGPNLSGMVQNGPDFSCAFPILKFQKDTFLGHPVVVVGSIFCIPSTISLSLITCHLLRKNCLCL